MNPELRSAYLRTTFRVFEPAIDIQVGKINADLNDLLEKNQQEEWAFITAWNPYSQNLSENENVQRHAALTKDLELYTCYDGEGVGEDPAWKPERSLLILGISRIDASALGVKYKQNAIVMGSKRSVAELVVLV